MLLDKIKLVGFKSFVDATPIHFPSRLVGIVGPNGCGKSNVIDAVRWVMGESAASRLRGEQGTDVIFNGSSGRQPVGQASVELVFDNSDASLGGEYAQYAEIAIRRQVSRDGISTYFLNGTKCRRRDIVDIFLGTGLGPRSYAIIQQGNISRIIEAKPEELRQLLEEAAGISKYKERRKETESRIKGARENLERLQDVRLELEKQLASLKRQANAAERFKELKVEQRQTKSELHALRWRAMNEKIASFQQKIAAKETELEAIISEVRQLETKIEHQRLAHTESVDKFNEQQSQYYRTNSELGKVEQEIKHQSERRQQLTFDFQQAESHWQSLNATLEHDKEQIVRLKQTEITLMPQLELAHETSEQASLELEEVEVALNKWQHAWNEFRDQMSKASKTAEVEQANIAQYEQRIVNINNKLQKLEQNFLEINVTSTEDNIALLQENIEKERQTTQEVQQALIESKQAAQSQQLKLRELSALIDSTKHQRQKLEGQKVSLEILQAAALSSGNEKTKQWLAQQGLSDKKRLAQTIQVDAGWEHAVETVLGDFLQSICIEKDSSNHLVNELLAFKQESLSLIYPHTSSASSARKLAEKIQCDHMPSDFYSIWTAENLEEALKIQATLSPAESVITPEGLWLGNNWMRVAYEKNQSQGILEREKELKRVAAEIISAEQVLTQHQMAIDAIEENMEAQQSHAEALQQQYQQVASRLSKAEADLSVQQRFLDQSTERRDNITQELTEQRLELQQLKQQLSHSRDLWSSALESLDALENQQSTLETEKEEKTSEVQQARQKNQHAKQVFHELTIKVNITETELKSLEKNIAQLQHQFATLEERKQQLTNTLSKSDTPITLLEERRELLLEANRRRGWRGLP
ncbi:MAG: chromosome segregation protein SMC, partial [Pseudomonadota bacterium]